MDHTRWTVPLFVTLGKYTHEGRTNIRQAPERYKDFIDLVESKGGKLVGAYGLMGEWDILTITEFPDNKTAMSVLVAFGKAGRVETQTLNAIHFEEFIDLAKNA